MRSIRPRRYLAAFVSAAMAVGFGLAAQSVEAETRLLTEDTVFVPSPRLSSMGGTHAALSDDLTTFFSNPAGFATAEPVIQATELGVRVRGPAFTIANLIVEGAQEDIDDVLTDPQVADLFSRLYADLALIGPLSYGYVGDGMGFLVSNNNGFSMESEGSSTLSLNFYQRLVLAGGFAFNIPFDGSNQEGLDVGFLLKGFFTGRSRFASTILDLPDTVDSLGPDMLTDQPFDLTTGVGVDMGLRYTPVMPLTLGLTVQNLISPAVVNQYSSLQAFLDNEAPTDRVRARIPQNISFGLMYRPALGPIASRHVSDLKILLDYRDIFDFWVAPRQAENIVMKFSLGTEITLLGLLDVRAGFFQGLPAAGLGIDFGAMEVDVASYGTELSTEPGFRSVYNLAFGVRFSW